MEQEVWEMKYPRSAQVDTSEQSEKLTAVAQSGFEKNMRIWADNFFKLIGHVECMWDERFTKRVI